MMDRRLFQDTFSELHASETCIQEVLSMTKEMQTPRRRASRAVLMTAAIAASLCVSAGVANAATDGQLFEAVEYHITSILPINDYQISMKTEDGGEVIVLNTQADVVKENGRVLLKIDEESIDITDDLAKDNAYTYEDTSGTTTLHIDVYPDEDNPGEWAYGITFTDPALMDDAGVSYTSTGSTACGSGSTDVQTQFVGKGANGTFTTMTNTTVADPSSSVETGGDR